MGWLSLNDGIPGTMARTVYGPDVRRETDRLKRVKEISPEVPAVTVLCYHEVRPDREDDCMNVRPEVFRRHIREFKEAGFTFIGVSDLRKYATGTPLPEKAVLITFDDGYADNYNYAYPILREEQVPATFFVVSSTVGNNNRMTAAQLREMQANGMQIGSHTVNHEPLVTMGPEEIDFELRASRAALEKILGKPVCALAYPAGKVNKTVLDKAKKYYEMAFLASVNPDQKQTIYTLQRYGVFSWNRHIESIFRNR
jgi:peptidoglycan/xylan/chitin deacetylase (PgdA/CDA1 family)